MIETLLTLFSAFWRYSKDNLAMEVVAIRDIQPGEEITHSCE
jgi:hypothetical protein